MPLFPVIDRPNYANPPVDWQPPRASFSTGDLHVDPYSRTAMRGDELIPLGYNPLCLIALFSQHPGQVFTREVLHRTIWGERGDERGKLRVRTAINRLRHLLGDHVAEPRYLMTIYGGGYVWLPKE